MCNFIKTNDEQCKLSPKKDLCWRHAQTKEVITESTLTACVPAKKSDTDVEKTLLKWIRANRSNISIIVTAQLFRAEGELMIDSDRVESIYSIKYESKELFYWISKNETLFCEKAESLGLKPMEIK